METILIFYNKNFDCIRPDEKIIKAQGPAISQSQPALTISAINTNFSVVFRFDMINVPKSQSVK